LKNDFRESWSPMLNSYSLKKMSLAVLLLAALIGLNGCGGSRDEPFDPGDGDDDNDNGPVVNVNVTLLTAGNDPILAADGNKRLQVMTTEEEYFDLLDQYTNEIVGEADFDNGQVLLYDAGFIDDNPCAHKLLFRRASAQEDGDNVVRVIIEYEDFEPESGNTCTEQIIATRPLRFFYIESRDKIIISERLQRSSSSRSSSSQSSSSSSFSSSSATVQ